MSRIWYWGRFVPSTSTTLMNTISGLLRPHAGEVVFAGRPIAGLPAHRIVREGVSHVLERRRLFPYLTVRQNVLLGAYNPAARARAADNSSSASPSCSR